MRFVGATILVGWLATSLVADKDKPKPSNPMPDAAAVKRGEYIVHRLARCGECHTPRNEKGELDDSRMLQGARIWFKPDVEPARWENKAPNITSTGKGGKLNDEKWVKLLTGHETPAMPMPKFKMTDDDAKAVGAYLRTVPGPKKD